MNEIERQRVKKEVNAEAAARSTRAALGLLAGEMGVSLKGLDEDQQNVVALRLVLSGDPASLQAIVDDVKRAEGLRTETSGKSGAGVDPAVTRSPSAHREDGSGAVGSTDTHSRPAPSSRPYRFNSTEADAKQRRKLAAQHRAESARTGLFLVPRRPDPLPVDRPHPACLVAARDKGTPCDRCSWLLSDSEYANAWLDRDDDRGAV